MNKFLASSADPKQLSLTVRGALVAAVPLVSVVLKIANSGVSNEEINQIINSVTDIVFLAGSLVSAGMMLYGLVRKVLPPLQKK